MKVSLLIPTLAASMVATIASAQTVEFSNLTTTTFRAPLPVLPKGWAYVLPARSNTTPIDWKATPSISFGADDNKGTVASCAGKRYPKHLGADYVAPTGTQVRAIADGVVRRAGYFTTDDVTGKAIGDAYVVVESGSTDKWTATYGHLVYRSVVIGTAIKKGDTIGTLFKFTYAGDVPHLHLGIHKGKYDGTSAAVRGFACPADPTYVTMKYGFVSPELLRYQTYDY